MTNCHKFSFEASFPYHCYCCRCCCCWQCFGGAALAAAFVLVLCQLTFSVTVTLRRLRVEKPEEQSVSVGELGQECVSKRCP